MKLFREVFNTILAGCIAVQLFSCQASSEPASGSKDTALRADSLPGSDSLMRDEAFWKAQMKYKNAQIALSEKETAIRELLRAHDLIPEAIDLYIRVIKKEEVLELWARDNRKKDAFRLIKSYTLCLDKNNDGLRGIDLLIPESFYIVQEYYPFDPYFARLLTNFPNAADKLRGRTGGDIAIHGGCFSTYCTPFTDNDIKEIYLMALFARAGGQTEVPVHNFPDRMTPTNMPALRAHPCYNDLYNKKVSRGQVWESMKPMFDAFEANHQLLDYSYDSQGLYTYPKVK